MLVTIKWGEKKIAEVVMTQYLGMPKAIRYDKS